MVHLVIGLVCVSIQTHISVTAGKNFIMGKMMDYDMGMMPVVLILSGIPEALTKMSFQKRFQCYKNMQSHTQQQNI